MYPITKEKLLLNVYLRTASIRKKYTIVVVNNITTRLLSKAIRAHAINQRTRTEYKHKGEIRYNTRLNTIDTKEN